MKSITKRRLHARLNAVQIPTHDGEQKLTIVDRVGYLCRRYMELVARLQRYE